MPNDTIDSGQTSNFAEPTGNTSEIDVDSLMNDLESPAPTRSMTTPTQETQPGSQTTPAQTQTPSQTGQSQQPPAAGEVEFTWNGKQIKTTLDKALRWSSQGYDYAQKTQALNIERQRFEHEQTEFKALKERYSEVDKYAKENPQWWEHVQNSYLQAKNQVDPAANIPPQILEKLNRFDQFIQSSEQEKVAQQSKHEDAELSQEISSVQGKYQDLDWKTPDAQGKSLEYKVLEHAEKNGIRRFETAFRDFYHDELVKLAQERAKEAVNKDVQKRTKAGVLGTTPTPQKGIKPVENWKNKTHEQILQETLEELGLS